MSSPAVLISSWRSSASYRVRICLNFKEIPFIVSPIDPVDEIQVPRKNGKTSESNEKLKKINPMGFVPILQIDGKNFIESMAIMEYLEETRPERPLLPKDAVKRAKVREICSIIVSGIQPMQNVVLDEKDSKNALNAINRGFTAIEKLLEDSNGKYCVGDDVTLADVCLVPQVLNARKLQVNLAPFPNIVRIDRILHLHSAFKKSHPFVQNDFPSEKFTDSSFFEIFKSKM
jgi:maleylacetoacetate isomerase